MLTAPTNPALRTAPAAPATEPRNGQGAGQRLSLADEPLLAKALLAVWSGDAALVIDSPPGAGKTRTITRLAQQLTERAGMRVAIAAQTRAQAYDVATRVAATGVPTTFAGKRGQMRPTGLDRSVQLRSRDRLHSVEGVVVATTAGWQWTNTSTFHADVLLVDEAYQMTWATFGSLGVLADRFALVGDPGQIAPVVTGSTRRWAHWSAGPHLPAPLALREAYRDDVTTLRLPHTWRLGPHTTALIKPLYPNLDFTSARPERALTRAGHALPEYGARPVTVTSGPSDPAIAMAAAEAARDLLDGHTRVRTPDGEHPLTEADVAVVAPHVDQATLIAAALADLPDVFVGTTNQAQGLEREAVVAVHPLAGYPQVEDFAADPGRLCVALSRHRAHLTVITDTHTPTVLTAALRQDATDAAHIQAAVLDRLLTGP